MGNEGGDYMANGSTYEAWQGTDGLNQLALGNVGSAFFKVGSGKEVGIVWDQ